MAKTSLELNGYLVDVVELWHLYNQQTWASHSPFQKIKRVETLVARTEVEGLSLEILDELQFQLMLLNNQRLIHVPNEVFLGGSRQYHEGIYGPGAQRWVVGKRFVTTAPQSYEPHSTTPITKV